MLEIYRNRKIVMIGSGRLSGGDVCVDVENCGLRIVESILLVRRGC